MRKILFSLLALTTFALSSCNDEEGNQAYQKFVTVRALDTTDYYFEMDNKKTIYPANKSDLIYTPKDGQRAIMLFSLEKTEALGYDYHAHIYTIYNIYTSSVEEMPVSDIAQQPNYPLEISDAVLVGDWLTIRVAHPATTETINNHTYKIVYDENNFEANSNYINLNLLHDAKGDSQETSSLYNDISFNTLAIDQFLTSKKGVKIAYQSLSTNKADTIKIDRPTDN